MEVVSRKHASRSVAEMEGEIYSTNPRNNQVKELALHFNFIHPPPPHFIWWAVSSQIERK